MSDFANVASFPLGKTGGLIEAMSRAGAISGST